MDYLRYERPEHDHHRGTKLSVVPECSVHSGDPVYPRQRSSPEIKKKKRNESNWVKKNENKVKMLTDFFGRNSKSIIALIGREKLALDAARFYVTQNRSDA